ncbi:MAG: TrpB-like pyridoxal phosphate-dependent enzyme [Conexivisphaerales archaeon]
MESIVAVHLTHDEIPTRWYNVLPRLPEPLPPPLDPETMQPVNPVKLERIFAKELIRQEVSSEQYIKIPDEVIEAYKSVGRPTPLFRAKKLEEVLHTPAEIYFKAESLNIAGSHKINTSLAQAYYNLEQGTEKLVTETGAGQWGTALAMATAIFGLKCEVYMVRASYDQKPGRKIIMETLGARIYPSPSQNTTYGQKLLKENPNHPGSLGVAISEALEVTLREETTRYSLGSVLNHVLLHQTVVGQEAKSQLEAIDRTPDVVIGCIGGGSNFAGFAYPFLDDKLAKKKPDMRFIAVEPTAVPSTTKGKYEYDFGDSAGMTPLLKMYTLGHNFTPPPIHAGGLRYHGKAPSLCLLINKHVIESVAYDQLQVFEAARLFARSTGIIPAPESAHAIKKAIDEAIEARRMGEKRIIAFNLSGHGLLDLSAYEQYNSNKLTNPMYEP